MYNYMQDALQQHQKNEFFERARRTPEFRGVRLGNLDRQFGELSVGDGALLCLVPAADALDVPPEDGLPRREEEIEVAWSRGPKAERARWRSVDHAPSVFGSADLGTLHPVQGHRRPVRRRG